MYLLYPCSCASENKPGILVVYTEKGAVPCIHSPSSLHSIHFSLGPEVTGCFHKSGGSCKYLFVLCLTAPMHLTKKSIPPNHTGQALPQSKVV